MNIAVHSRAYINLGHPEVLKGKENVSGLDVWNARYARLGFANKTLSDVPTRQNVKNRQQKTAITKKPSLAAIYPRFSERSAAKKVRQGQNWK